MNVAILALLVVILAVLVFVLWVLTHIRSDQLIIRTWIGRELQQRAYKPRETP